LPYGQSTVVLEFDGVAATPYSPMLPAARFWTSEPAPMVMLALSPSEMTLASPTTTCVPGSSVTVAPAGVWGPAPIVVVHGDGADESQVVSLPVTTQFA
jgi:hypothetical protein